MRIKPNALYQVDCINLLQRLESESVDLIYLDTPSESQFQNNKVSSLNSGPDKSYDYGQFISHACQQAYRVLRPTGALFFHTTPANAFTVRLILNQVFTESSFLQEIIWQFGKKSPSIVFRPIQHNNIFHYIKSDKFVYNIIRRPLSQDEIKSQFKYSDEKGLFSLADLTRTSRYNLKSKWNGISPPANRSWRYSFETLQQFEKEGRIYKESAQSIPKLKMYLSESSGVEVDTIWNDIPLLSPKSKEKTQFDSQQPLGLLERIILMGTNQGHTILDPFCGSGTALVAAERLQRKWIGCDILKEGIEITTQRLIQEFEDSRSTTFILGDFESISDIPVKQATYRKVKVRVDDFNEYNTTKFILNQKVNYEENRYVEFKEIKSSNNEAAKKIADISEEYAVAFLNSEGGRLLFGVQDDSVATGIRLNFNARNELRQNVTTKLNQIEPKLDPSQYRLNIHDMFDETEEKIPDLCIVELIIPMSTSEDPFYTSTGSCYIKLDGVNQKLKGAALTDFIKRRLKEEK